MNQSTFQRILNEELAIARIARLREQKEKSGQTLCRAVLKNASSKKEQFKKFVSKLEDNADVPLTDEEIDARIKAWAKRNSIKY
jgi:hypothetical protein